ncbi:Ig-like domain repeat protein [Candidatus Bathyarchaeota archaeon]|nr:Ig-like domain repeat protein [Candidatus Bathyarchaeota archaeon]
MFRKQYVVVLKILLLLTSVYVNAGFMPSITVRASSTPNIPYNLGNWTYVTKPVYPVKINASQIPIGCNWTLVYTLRCDSFYHIYFYGDWISTLTDYDIYVYDPNGKLETLHTEAAGLPEHLGTTVDDPFFKPNHSGNYSFLIVNDLKESHGEAAATFMLIENIECNRWHERYITGKVNFEHVYNTTWAYEFSTNSSRVEVIIDVPNTLDMYEARLYIMANPSKNLGSLMNGKPVAWEPGLYGILDASKMYGGYNLEDDGFKISPATASCEYFGDDMFINYTSPSKGSTILYHLVLIGENGNGVLKFMIKTDFNPPEISILNQVSTVIEGNETIITVNVKDQDSLKAVLLKYSNDGWRTVTSASMSHVANQTYRCTIPAQPAGTTINYVISASDIAGNEAETQGSFKVKDQPNLTIFLHQNIIYANEKVEVSGQMPVPGAVIMLNYTCSDKEVVRYVTVSQNSSFTDLFMPEKIGNWTVSAYWQGDETHFAASSDQKKFVVQKVPTSLNCSISKETIDLGSKITITGNVHPINTGKPIKLAFTMPNSTVTEKYTYVNSEGTFSIELTPQMPGTWKVQAYLAGDNVYLPSTSESLQFVVNDTWLNIIVSFISQNLIYIVAAIGATVSAVGFFIYWRRRGE